MRMRCVPISIIAAAAAALSLPTRAPAQTEGTVEFRVTTQRASGEYAPRHVLAIWVTDSQNRFVKTLEQRGERRQRYLYTWNEQSGGDVTDAITGATMSSHQSHVATWDCRDTAGAPAPDGEYRIRAEFTSEHVQGPLTPESYLEFTKGPDPFTLDPEDLQYFTNMSLVYGPETNTNTLVSAGSVWKYDDSGTDLHGEDWRGLDYDDSLWSSGPGKLGYSDGAATTLDYGPDDQDKYPCYYFRHRFSVDYLPDSLDVRVLRDDGIVVYLNDVEIARDNMAAGDTAYASLATGTVGGSEESTYFRFNVDSSLVALGANVLAAEVHQGSASSSDLGFDLELRASPPALASSFLRGNANGDRQVDVSDAVHILGYLFTAGAAPDCMSTADANDDSLVDISDPIAVVIYLFAGGPALPAPYPDCGSDPTPDGLYCNHFSACGE